MCTIQNYFPHLSNLLTTPLLVYFFCGPLPQIGSKRTQKWLCFSCCLVVKAIFYYSFVISPHLFLIKFRKTGSTQARYYLSSWPHCPVEKTRNLCLFNDFLSIHIIMEQWIWKCMPHEHFTENSGHYIKIFLCNTQDWEKIPK